MNQTKHIIILSHWLEIGGAEKSMIGLLKSIDYQKYGVDLFLCRHTGELMSMIPPEVNLLPEDSLAAAIAKPIKELMPAFWKYYKIIYARVLAKVRNQLCSIGSLKDKDCIAEIGYVHRYVCPYIQPINKEIEYDAAISFLAPHYLGIYKVNAKKRIAWIHTDYQNVDTDVRMERKMWRKYNVIVSVSDKCKENFQNKFGNLENEIVCIENILQTDMVRQEAEKIPQSIVDQEIGREPDEIILCTVGRFSSPKKIDGIPGICSHIIAAGFNIKWLIIGFGPDETIVRRRIEETRMNDHIIILGKKDNPYPYMKACDIYVQPSRYEGKAVTVREAQILGKPVIITNYETAPSQIEDGVDGIIAPMDDEGCASRIISLIRSEEQQKQLSNNCLNRDYGNVKEIEKIYALLE